MWPFWVAGIARLLYAQCLFTRKSCASIHPTHTESRSGASREASALSQNSPLLATMCQSSMRTNIPSAGAFGWTRNDVSKTCSLIHLKVLVNILGFSFRSSPLLPPKSTTPLRMNTRVESSTYYVRLGLCCAAMLTLKGEKKEMVVHFMQSFNYYLRLRLFVC